MQTVLRSTQGVIPGSPFVSSWYPIPGFSVANPLPMAAGGPQEASYLSFSIYSDQPGTIQIQETDDATNPALIHAVPNATFSFIGGTALFQHGILVKRSSWRVVVTNTGAAQKTFELCVNQCVTQPEIFDPAGNLYVNVANPAPVSNFSADPSSLLPTPALSDVYRVLLAILYEIRVNNMLLLKISEPYSPALLPSFRMSEPDGILGSDTN